MTANDFFQGNVFDAYEYFGAHVCRNESGEELGVWFRVFAPNASKVALFGECNNWGETVMNRCEFYGVFECFCPDARTGQMYKYRIWGQNGTMQEHADPYGFGMEVRPAFCSIVRDVNEYSFGDKEWMENRTVCADQALNIYEIHAGSWKKPDWEEVQARLAGNGQEGSGIKKEAATDPLLAISRQQEHLGDCQQEYIGGRSRIGKMGTGNQKEFKEAADAGSRKEFKEITDIGKPQHWIWKWQTRIQAPHNGIRTRNWENV